jgi:hypothetical protein
MPVRQWKGSVCYCPAVSATWLYWESKNDFEWATNWEVAEHHVVEQCWDGIEHTHIQAVRQHKQHITSVCYQSLHRAHEIWVFIGPLLSLSGTGRQGRFCLENWNRDKSFDYLLLNLGQGKIKHWWCVCKLTPALHLPVLHISSLSLCITNWLYTYSLKAQVQLVGTGTGRW